MKGYGKSREELFHLTDKPALRPLPEHRYAYATWKKVRVGFDYHVQFERCFYSVPYTFAHQEAFARVSEKTVEVLIDGKQVALHARLFAPGSYSTVLEHMPPKHYAHAKWTPERLISWATSIGPHTQAAIERLFASKSHPQQGVRPALGILSFSKTFSTDELEHACAHVNAVGIPSYRRIEAALKAKNKTELQPSQDVLALHHSNVRGGGYYH